MFRILIRVFSSPSFFDETTLSLSSLETCNVCNGELKWIPLLLLLLVHIDRKNELFMRVDDDEEEKENKVWRRLLEKDGIDDNLTKELEKYTRVAFTVVVRMRETKFILAGERKKQKKNSKR